MLPLGQGLPPLPNPHALHVGAEFDCRAVYVHTRVRTGFVLVCV